VRRVRSRDLRGDLPADPTGNEIELAADRPRDVWPDLANPGWDGGPRPPDLPGLLELVAHEDVRPYVDAADRINDTRRT